MQVEQEFATPGDAVLAHYGKKGMKWGVLNPSAAKASVDRGVQSTKKGVQNATSKVTTSVNRGVKDTKQGVQNVASKTTASVDSRIKGAKQSVDDKIKDTKKNAEVKKQTVAENAVVKDVGREAKGTVWGTRQAYIEKTLKDVERLDNISKGTAGIDSKVLAAKDGVFTKRQAKVVSPIFANHTKRIQEGKLKTRDLLLMSVRLRRRDLTIGMDLAGKKNDRAKKRGRDVNFDIPVGLA